MPLVEQTQPAGRILEISECTFALDGAEYALAQAAMQSCPTDTIGSDGDA